MTFDIYISCEDNNDDNNDRVFLPAKSTCELACGWTSMQVSALTIIAERYEQAEWCCDGATIVLGENVGVDFGIAPLVVAV